MDALPYVTTSFDTAAALPLARAYFLRASGLDSASRSPIHERMRKRAAMIEELVLPMVDIRAVYARFPDGALAGDTLSMPAFDKAGTVAFRCAAFERLDPASTRAAYAYAVTAGDVYLETDNISDKLFADIYGSGFVEAASHMLRALLLRETGGAPHFAFGPGFFGTDTSMLRDFARALPLDSIGVRVNASSVLIPVKSCAGFYIVSHDARRLPKRDCASCTGKAGGCRLCQDYGD